MRYRNASIKNIFLGLAIFTATSVFSSEINDSKIKKIEQTYASEVFNENILLIHPNSDKTKIKEIKSTLEKFPAKSRKEIGKIYFCDQTEYDGISNNESKSEGFTLRSNGTIFIKDYDESCLERVVAHESTHSIELTNTSSTVDIKKEWGQLLSNYSAPKIIRAGTRQVVWEDANRVYTELCSNLQKNEKKITLVAKSLEGRANELSSLKESMKIEENIRDFNKKNDKLGPDLYCAWVNLYIPRNGFVTPYSASSPEEDRAETASFAITKPKIIRDIINGRDTKAAELMSKKLLLLKKYEYISSETYQSCIKK